VFRYTREWEELTKRLGFWVNLDDAYVTFHQSYVESVWWGLKTLFERGLLYQGHKVVWWWAQGGTALSAGEVGEGYRTVDDPSVFVKFPLVGQRRSDGAQVRGPYGRSTNLAAGLDHNAMDVDLEPLCGRASRAGIRARPRSGEPMNICTSRSDLVEAIGNKVKRELEVVQHVQRCRVDWSALSAALPDLYYTSMGEQTATLKDGVELHTIGWRVTAADFVTTDFVVRDLCTKRRPSVRSTLSYCRMSGSVSTTLTLSP
jgi:isoleucyl-tRNA synthetase